DGTTYDLTLGGALTRPVNAPQHPNPSSPTRRSSELNGDVTETGVVNTGELVTGEIDGDVAGTFNVVGDGTIDDLTIGGDLSGTGTADDAPNLGSRIIYIFTINGDVNDTGEVNTGHLV